MHPPSETKCEATKSKLPWVEKHRPKCLDEVAGQEEVAGLLKQTVKTGNLPNVLFYGPPGTGKTSTILALATELFGPHVHSRVLEMNASDERGIAVVREKIKTFASISINNNAVRKDPVTGDDVPLPPFKLVILDEADSMTKDAQSALRRIMENHSTARFCLICNYVNKIIDPIISRCALFRFKPLPGPELKNRLDLIIKLEDISVTPEAKEEILQISRGDLRASVTLLQCASQFSQGNVTAKAVVEISGTLPRNAVDKLWETWETKSFDLIQTEVERILSQGYSTPMILTKLAQDLMTRTELDEDIRMKMFIILADSELALVEGANEQLQMLNVAAKFMQILKTA